MQTLSSDKISERLSELTGWSLAGNSIRKQFKFADFQQAFAFMSTCARAAEELDHHPDWQNSYNVVNVELSTHSAGGLTERDFELARRMQQAAGQDT